MKKLETYEITQCPGKKAAARKPTNQDPGIREEIVVLGHCLLNPPARIKGARPKPPLDVTGMNVIQLPCPEAMYLGMNRREITKDQLDFPAYRRFCRKIFTPYADLIEDFAAGGAKIRILGVPKSPSCGVKITSVGGEPGKAKEFHHTHVEGSGVFIEEIKEELGKRGVVFEIEDARMGRN